MKKVTRPNAITLTLVLLTSLCLFGCFTVSKDVGPNGETNIHYVVSGNLSNAVGVVHTAAPFLPPPYNTLAVTAATVALGVLGFIARVKTVQANEHLSLIEAMIRGVENSESKPAKEAIQASARASGLEGQLAPIVAKVTAGS